LDGHLHVRLGRERPYQARVGADPDHAYAWPGGRPDPLRRPRRVADRGAVPRPVSHPPPDVPLDIPMTRLPSQAHNRTPTGYSGLHDVPGHPPKTLELRKGTT